MLSPLQVTSVLVGVPAANAVGSEIKKLIGVGFVTQLLESTTDKLYDPTHKLVNVSTETLVGNDTDGLESKV